MAAVVLNFMCVLAWALGWPDIWADIILGVSVRVFWVRLTCKLEGSRLPSPRWVGHTQSVHWNKRLNLPWGRENSSCLTGVELGCHLFPASGPGLKHQFWGLGLLAFGWEQLHQLPWVPGLWTWMRL